jgi:hypothetical protein
MRHWSHGGPTAVHNLVLVCAYHHGELHKPDNWTVSLDTDDLPTFIPPAHVDPTSTHSNDPNETATTGGTNPTVHRGHRTPTREVRGLHRS